MKINNSTSKKEVLNNDSIWSRLASFLRAFKSSRWAEFCTYGIFYGYPE